MKLGSGGFTIRTKLMLLGIGCVFATALSMMGVGIWQGSVFSARATQEAINLVDDDLDHIAQGVYTLIKTQDDTIQRKVDEDLKVARYVLNQAGRISLSSNKVTRNTVNQYTNQVYTVTIPEMLIGNAKLDLDPDQSADVQVVDRINLLVGDTCTLFQRSNPDGDLLRIATNEKLESGARAIGTYIPAVNPDGTPNLLVKTIMEGRTYYGLSPEVNRWRVTAYQPLLNDKGRIIGALHIGVEHKTIVSMRNAIQELKIGPSGYVFVLGGKGVRKGHYIISKNGRRDGENLWNVTDSYGQKFVQDMIRKAIESKPGELVTVKYAWRNPGEAMPRRKIARLCYYEPWDWVIGASVYEDEISKSTEIFSHGYKKMIQVFAFVAGVVAVLGGLVTWLFARRMAYTLGVVTRAAKKITEADLPRLLKTMDAVNQGDLSVTFQFDAAPVEITSTDELGSMARAFNSMNNVLNKVGTAFTTMVANLHDLTGLLEDKVGERTAELKESERKLSNIIDFLPDATLVIDNRGKVIAWNHAMEKLTGISSEEMVGKAQYAYAIPFFGKRQPLLIDLVLEPNKHYESQYDVFKREGNTLFCETCSKHLREDPVHILAAASALYDSNGEVVGAIETFRDISEWKSIEHELIEAKLTAEEATKAKGDFLANMSHEIRTPMNGVMGMTSLLMDTALDDDQQEYVRTVQNSADALLTVINDILDFSKIEAGKLDFEKLNFDLRLTLDEIGELIALKAEEKQIEFANYIHPNVPSMLVGDPGRLRQILINLASNAVKFTNEGDVVIEVAVEREDEYSVDLHFAVKDSGIGIPADRLNRLFKSFSQVDGSTTRKFGGTGLGLAISKRLVQMMDGQIGVKSQEDSGSTFWFTVSLKKQADAQKHDNKPIMPVDIQGKRILAVDDNETNRKIIQAYLQSWRCHASVVDDGQQAISLMTLAAENGMSFDMAIVDFMMPGMDGEQLCRTIKAHPLLKNTRMVLLTSRGIRGDAARARNAGYDAYLTKPIKQSQLFDAILTVFGITAKKSAKQTDKTEIITRHSIAETDKKKVRILLTEDNLVNQKVALIHLRKFGFNADVANNGKEAVKAVKNNSYDLVLMDVQMPEMDGYDATRIIRSTGLDLPIIAMTANAMKGDREKCLDSGMDDYIPKPVNPRMLLEKLEKWLSVEGKDKPPANDSADAVGGRPAG